MIRITTKIVPLGPSAMPNRYKKFRRRTDRQTDHTQNITSFFGGGNNLLNDQECSKLGPMLPCIFTNPTDDQYAGTNYKQHILHFYWVY